MDACKSFPFLQNMKLLSLSIALLNWAADVTMQREEQILNCTMPDMEDGYVNQGEEIVAMIEETPSVLEMTTNQVGMNANIFFL